MGEPPRLRPNPPRDGQLKVPDFAKLFGTTSRDLSQRTRHEIENHDFSYRSLNRDERDRLILTVLSRIASTDLTIAGDESARNRWEAGWTENLVAFNSSNRLSTLVPKYVRRGQELRLFGDYVKPIKPNFELNWFGILRNWLFEKYLADVDSVYEFGSGTGYNLVALAKMYPEKQLYGLDWSSASVELVNSVSRSHGFRMKGIPFNLEAPDSSLSLGRYSAVVTFTALEQLGNRFEKFLRFLMKKGPAVCINVEPILELYDESNLLDYLAIMFHRRRGYLEGFVPRLLALEAEKKLQVIKLNRSNFGSLFLDGYSFVVWKPTERESAQT